MTSLSIVPKDLRTRLLELAEQKFARHADRGPAYELALAAARMALSDAARECEESHKGLIMTAASTRSVTEAKRLHAEAIRAIVASLDAP